MNSALLGAVDALAVEITMLLRIFKLESKLSSSRRSTNLRIEGVLVVNQAAQRATVFVLSMEMGAQLLVNAKDVIIHLKVREIAEKPSERNVTDIRHNDFVSEYYLKSCFQQC
jgi:hypothetical protein